MLFYSTFVYVWNSKFGEQIIQGAIQAKRHLEQYWIIWPMEMELCRNQTPNNLHWNLPQALYDWTMHDDVLYHGHDHTFLIFVV